MDNYPSARQHPSIKVLRLRANLFFGYTSDGGRRGGKEGGKQIVVIRVSDFLTLKPFILPTFLPYPPRSNVSMFRDEFYASMVEVGANIKVRASAPLYLLLSSMLSHTHPPHSPASPSLALRQAVIIDASGVLEMDLSALAVIDELVSEMQKQKVRREERREGGRRKGGRDDDELVEHPICRHRGR